MARPDFDKLPLQSSSSLSTTETTQIVPTERRLFGILIPELPKSIIPIKEPDLNLLPKGEEYALVALRQNLEDAVAILAQAGGPKPPQGSIRMAEPPRGVSADFGIPCHQLAKMQGLLPNQVADNLAARFNQMTSGGLNQPIVAASEKGYLNFQVEIGYFGTRVLKQVEQLGERYGKQNIGRGETVVIDCSSPNIAKYMSVGHLRSTVIGESLSRIYGANGYKVIRDNHLGDWGTQFGMLGRAYELWSADIGELNNPAMADPVKGLYELYVKMHEEIARQKQQDPDQESTLETEGKEWFKRLESGDPEARKLFNWASVVSLNEFQRVYDLLGVEFEYMLGESFYVDQGMIPDVLNALKQSGVAQTDEKGMVVIPIEETKLNPLAIQKSDGTSLYSTREIAALVSRMAWFDPAKILYVVGADQKAYFQQVFAASNKITGGQGPQCKHIYFGMVSLPEGKLSTREGRVVFLEDMLSEAVLRSKQRIQETNRNLPEIEVDDIARQVGVGAVIYFDLGQGRERNILFNWDDALSLEGNSAPYIQYANSRACSILDRAKKRDILIDPDADAVFKLPEEQALIKQLARFPDAIVKAHDLNQPSVIAEYLLTVATDFNQFYKSANVINEQDPTKRNTRLRLTAATSQVIRTGLYLLGIEAPNRM